MKVIESVTNKCWEVKRRNDSAKTCKHSSLDMFCKMRNNRRRVNPLHKRQNKKLLFGHLPLKKEQINCPTNLRCATTQKTEISQIHRGKSLKSRKKYKVKRSGIQHQLKKQPDKLLDTSGKTNAWDTDGKCMKWWRAGKKVTEERNYDGKPSRIKVETPVNLEVVIIHSVTDWSPSGKSKFDSRSRF